jgi:hypothetical protein
LQNADVEKGVTAATVERDEAEPTLGVEPLHHAAGLRAGRRPRWLPLPRRRRVSE